MHRFYRMIQKKAQKYYYINNYSNISYGGGNGGNGGNGGKRAFTAVFISGLLYYMINK